MRSIISDKGKLNQHSVMLKSPRTVSCLFNALLNLILNGRVILISWLFRKTVIKFSFGLLKWLTQVS